MLRQTTRRICLQEPTTPGTHVLCAKGRSCLQSESNLPMRRRPHLHECCLTEKVSLFSRMKLEVTNCSILGDHCFLGHTGIQTAYQKLPDVFDTKMLCNKITEGEEQGCFFVND